jgi:hypothetical protein
MTRRRSVFLTAVVAALAATAPPAAADDGSLFSAYVARQLSEVDPASDAYVRAVDRLMKARRPRAVRRAFRSIIRADKRINRALRRIERDIEQQAPSSAAGRRARGHAFKELRGWRRANRIEMRVVRQILAGSSDTASTRRQLRRGDEIMRRVYRYGRGAVRQFAKVGLSDPVGPVSAR